MDANDDVGTTTASRRGEVLRLLRESVVALSIATLAERLGVHPNTVRFHLGTLVVNGQVERVAPADRKPGRPPQLFRAIRQMDRTGPRNYRVLAAILSDALGADPDGAARAVAAGREWGVRYAADAEGEITGDTIGRLVAMMNALGFAPERIAETGAAACAGGGAGGGADAGALGSDRGRIGLHNCPFLELVDDRQEVVCGIHLGLMQGALREWDSPMTVDDLHPFVEPDLCVAHLTNVTRPAPGSVDR